MAVRTPTLTVTEFQSLLVLFSVLSHYDVYVENTRI